MENKLSYLGSESNLGILILVKKGRYFAGISNSVPGRKPLYRTMYEAYFYNSSNKIVAWLGSDKPSTTIVTTRSKANMTKFLVGNGYTEFEIKE
ncbi:hypothetical protein ACU1JV_00475 [Paenibacillus sp. T2-29]